MTRCFFVSDLHGFQDRYRKLFDVVLDEAPGAVFMGGDLFPSGLLPETSTGAWHQDFVNDFLARELEKLRVDMGERFPRIFVIMGNDDPRFHEPSMLAVAARGLWDYINERDVSLGEYSIFGYSYVPPTPFRLKDWERYDVSRYVDPGCVSPEEGARSIPVTESQARYSTIAGDLESLIDGYDLDNSVFLFHSPPYKSVLDRAGLDGKMIDYVPLDVHVGSIAIQRFISEMQPSITLHGHIHESVRITGSWREQIGRTHVFGAAHDGPELALVRFDLENPQDATRDLL